jgi:hypothetical protein
MIMLAVKPAALAQTASVTLGWPKIAQSGRRYEVCRATLNTIGTVSGCEAATIVQPFTADIATATVLCTLPECWFNVVSADASDHKIAYLPIVYPPWPTAPSICFQSAATWHSQQIATQTGSFTVVFDATPSTSINDSVIGVSAKVAGVGVAAYLGYADLATTVRFNASGFIDAIKSASYTSDQSLAYTANTAYHFRMVVSVPAHTYSVFVTPSGHSEIQLATNYAFRSTQATLTSLSYVSDYSEVGTTTICNVTLQ